MEVERDWAERAVVGSAEGYTEVDVGGCGGTARPVGGIGNVWKKVEIGFAEETVAEVDACDGYEVSDVDRAVETDECELVVDEASGYGATDDVVVPAGGVSDDDAGG